MSFILYNRYVLNLITKESYPLDNDNPETIASALAKIRAKQQKKIKLYLPPSFFIATDIATDAIKNLSQSQLQQALSYQQEELLPGLSGDVSVVASANDKHRTALWIPTEWIDTLQLALNKVGLELDYIALRSLLAAVNNKQVVLIEDVEAEQNTLIEVDNNGIVNYAVYQHIDLKEEDIQEEYKARIAEYSTASQYLRLDQIENWKKLPTDVEVDKIWRFYPSTALQNKVKKRTRRIRLLAAIGIFSILLVGSLPFLKIAYEKYHIKKIVTNLEEQGQSVIKARSDIAGHTHYWEALDTFPNPKVLSLLYELDKHVPTHSWLTGFRLREAVLEIEGYSSDPAAVLEALSTLPDYSSVAFSQATRQERAYPDKEFFGIRLHLRNK